MLNAGLLVTMLIRRPKCGAEPPAMCAAWCVASVAARPVYICALSGIQRWLRSTLSIPLFGDRMLNGVDIPQSCDGDPDIAISSFYDTETHFCHAP